MKHGKKVSSPDIALLSHIAYLASQPCRQPSPLTSKTQPNITTNLDTSEEQRWLIKASSATHRSIQISSSCENFCRHSGDIITRKKRKNMNKMMQIIAGFFGLQLHSEASEIKGQKSEGSRDSNKTDFTKMGSIIRSN